MSGIVKLEAYYKKAIWGHEDWLVSCYPGCESSLGDDALSRFIQINYLNKFIKTHQNLSVQVHPDIKNELWIISQAEEGAGVYLGVKPGVKKKELANAAQMGLQLDQYLLFHPVKRGDFFFVPAGTIHAIGAGISLFEVQQSADATYRLWDWNRVGQDGRPRELHIDKGLEVTKLKPQNEIKGNLFETDDLFTIVHQFEKIGIESIQLKAGKEFDLNMKSKESLIIFEGELSINGCSYQEGETFIALKDESCHFKCDQKTTMINVKDLS